MAWRSWLLQHSSELMKSGLMSRRMIWADASCFSNSVAHSEPGNVLYTCHVLIKPCLFNGLRWISSFFCQSSSSGAHEKKISKGISTPTLSLKVSADSIERFVYFIKQKYMERCHSNYCSKQTAARSIPTIHASLAYIVGMYPCNRLLLPTNLRCLDDHRSRATRCPNGRKRSRFSDPAAANACSISSRPSVKCVQPS